jgi:hypothetical protein
VHETFLPLSLPHLAPFRCRRQLVLIRQIPQRTDGRGCFVVQVQIAEAVRLIRQIRRAFQTQNVAPAVPGPQRIAEQGICIGSPYVHNIIVIGMDGKIIKSCEGSLNQDLERYISSIKRTKVASSGVQLNARRTCWGILPVLYTVFGWHLRTLTTSARNFCSFKNSPVGMAASTSATPPLISD